MAGSTEDIKTPEEKSRDPKVDLEQRRRLIKGGLAAAPVLMTLVSRPVLGRDKPPAVLTSCQLSIHPSGCANRKK